MTPYEVCPEVIQLCNMKNRDIYWRRYKIQETLYKGQWYLNPLWSRHTGISNSSPNCHQLPPQSYIASLSQVILVLEKARSCRVPNGAESPGWYDVSPTNSAWDGMQERACCCDEAASHQLPRPAAFWIIWSFRRGISKLNVKSDADSLLYLLSLILNGMAIQYTCSPNGIYSSHWLVQWSHHCSQVCIPVHSPWLPGYTDVHKPFS